MGPNAKELFRLVEDFVDVIGFRMKDLRDAYQVTDNLGKPTPRSAGPSMLWSCGPGQGSRLSFLICVTRPLCRPLGQYFRSGLGSHCPLMADGRALGTLHSGHKQEPQPGPGACFSLCHLLCLPAASVFSALQSQRPRQALHLLCFMALDGSQFSP